MISFCKKTLVKEDGVVAVGRDWLKLVCIRWQFLVVLFLLQAKQITKVILNDSLEDCVHDIRNYLQSWVKVRQSPKL
jgi:hypothetical protein